VTDILLLAFAAVYCLAAIGSLGAVGKVRKPLTPTQGALAAVIDLLMAAYLIYFVASGR
jgi:hypothetical protein